MESGHTKRDSEAAPARRSLQEHIEMACGRHSQSNDREDIRNASPLPSFTILDLPNSTLNNLLDGRDAPLEKQKRLHSAPTTPHRSHGKIRRHSIVQRAGEAIKGDVTEPDGGAVGRKEKGIFRPIDKGLEAQGHDVGCETCEDSLALFKDENEMRRVARRALWKLDLVIVPLMSLAVMLQYLDKAIFSYAALLGLQTDLRITGGQYSFAASLYYIGMISGLPLWTFMLQLVSCNYVMGATVALWGCVTMCHAATQNYSGILAVRFFLGFLESAVTPALVLTTGTFYNQLETITRTAIWYAFNGVALILGGGVSYGLLVNPTVITSPLPIWRQLYLILGGITILVGLLILLFMPAHPSRTRLLSKKESEASVHRVASQYASARRGSAATTISKTTNTSQPYTGKKARIQWSQWTEALMDVRLYLFFVGLLVGSVPNGGVTAFSTQLLTGFGFDVKQTLLISLAPGGGQIVSVLLFIGTALLTRSRILGANLLLFIAIAGSTMMYVASTGRTAKTVGYVLLNFGSPAVVALYSFVGSAVQGHGKRVLFTIVSQLAYALGNIIGPLVFLESEALVGYPTAERVIIGTLSGAAITLFLVGFTHLIWNYRRNEREVERDATAQSRRDSFSEDKTDFKDESFRYVF